MPGAITPMMRQYLDLKEKYNDCLLFFRLGDFYEMFFEDALTASRELEIVLTGRDCGLEERAPMCGVPYHSVDTYINRLIQKGYKVAICEQLTDPALAKGLVERDVIRIITPGTVIEESMLEEGQNNFIVSLFWQDDQVGIAYADVSTGGFYLGELCGKELTTQLYDELARIQPREIVANDGLFLQSSLIKQLSSTYYLQNYGGWAFAEQTARERLERHFHVSSLDGFGCGGLSCGICAAGALMAYLEDTQKNALTHIGSIQVINRSAYMALDFSTRRNLELTEPLRTGGSKKNTLLYLLDKTKTAMGSRMLRVWIEQPLIHRAPIEARLEAVGELCENMVLRKSFRDALSNIYDMERLCSRIAYGTVNARDCVALRRSLGQLPAILELLFSLKATEFQQIQKDMDRMEDILNLMERAIVDDPPLSVKEGGVIRSGYHSEVDSLRDASSHGKQWLSDLEAREREQTKIKNLKVGFNKVFGYYIEVTKSYQHLVPYTYQRKQTLANAERYITPELKKLEETILGAEEKLIALEYQLFVALREELLGCTARLQKDAALLAKLDCYQSLAEAASNNRYCKPQMLDSGILEIKNGRHPIVELAMKDSFIPNDTTLDEEENRLLILTGPNMAGKSTYMRQVALIVLMAHIGSFVPADCASIVMTDRIFTRVGASDDLAAGQSTFMVEMSEMANILNNATSKSLLILDEIGRGTSTFDGLSIAWAVLEHIADKSLCGAKCLFATHYHELTELEGRLGGVKNYRISVKEVGEDILFLRKIMRGGADKSFGVQVARLAGLPDGVIRRARAILKELENADINRPSIGYRPEPQRQMSLFVTDEQQAVLMELTELDVDALTPLQALNTLNELHQRAKICRT